MKTNIVAIGGGDIRLGETLAIDQLIVSESGKPNPRLLFIPTASSDSASYITEVEKYFGNLGCSVDTLHLIAEKPSRKIIEETITSADIIYVGGGNTLKMMTHWRRLGIDKLLHQAHKRGTMLSGISAGSICWFAYGNSDSRKFKNPEADLIRVTGLGFIPALHCPHYHKEADRKNSLKEMTRKTGNVAIAIDDRAALQVKGDMCRVVQAAPMAHAYKAYWKRGVFYEEKLSIQEFRPLVELIEK